jgi:hypothetical protein
MCGASWARRGILRRNDLRKTADLAVTIGGALEAASASLIGAQEHESSVRRKDRYMTRGEEGTLTESQE